ncbi:MAG: S-layer homology domain-containing protein, partial [Clostridiaceae bacterium]|nr:S-layer homology domain-containing protein [Clostridiaceae bacterium]
SALQWACGAGIISGTGDGSTLTPQGEATRAQAAVMLMRFCEQSIQ